MSFLMSNFPPSAPLSFAESELLAAGRLDSLVDLWPRYGGPEGQQDALVWAAERLRAILRPGSIDKTFLPEWVRVPQAGIQVMNVPDGVLVDSLEYPGLVFLPYVHFVLGRDGSVRDGVFTDIPTANRLERDAAGARDRKDGDR